MLILFSSVTFKEYPPPYPGQAAPSAPPPAPTEGYSSYTYGPGKNVVLLQIFVVNESLHESLLLFAPLGVYVPGIPPKTKTI